MARKPKANSHDKTIRNMIIGFGAIVLIIAAVLIWNNRDLSYAGTVDGERMSFSQLQFEQNQAWWMLLDWGMMPDNDTADFALQIGFENLVDLYVTINRAANFGLSLADVDVEDIENRIAWYQMMFNNEDFDVIASLGFNNTTFRRFIEMRVLQDLVYEHVTEQLEVREDALDAAYEAHLEENFFFLRDFLVHIIDTESIEDAEDILEQLEAGVDFVDLMRAHSFTYDPNNQEVADDGTITETRNARLTTLQDNDGHLRMVYGMEEGEISGIIELEHGIFSIVEVVTINEMVADYEVFEANFRAQQEGQWRDEYFRERLQGWRDEAEVVRNTRVVGEGFE